MKLTGSSEFLHELWPSVKKTLNYVFLKWDTDDDFVDSEQHVTYDIELYGPNPLTTILILGAVKAAAEMALYLGEEHSASLYQKIFEKSFNQVDKILGNQSYYEQKLDDVNKYKYQHGQGCLSDINCLVNN